VTPSGDDDPRLRLVYEESLRGLLQQQSAVESLHNRAATVVFATSFASSLLGTRALADGLGLLDWTALALLLCIGALTVTTLWPYYDLTFRFDAEDLLRAYVDVEPVPSLSQVHRGLALEARRYFHRNGRIVRRLREAIQVALVLLLLEIVAWMLSIAGVGT
jgi:hypothetical protein